MNAIWRERATAIRDATGPNMAFTFQPIPVNHVAEAMAEGGNPPGVPSIKHQCKLAVYVSALAMGLQKLIPDAWTTLVDW